jgi:hypothetical protein
MTLRPLNRSAVCVARRRGCRPPNALGDERILSIVCDSVHRQVA